MDCQVTTVKCVKVYLCLVLTQITARSSTSQPSSPSRDIFILTVRKSSGAMAISRWTLKEKETWDMHRFSLADQRFNFDLINLIIDKSQSESLA